jgi:undecaprenyl pyrophosphate phosphatase UppP
MNLIEVLVLAIIQGITERLLISNLLAVSVAFMLTGCILYASKLSHDRNKSINYFD